jgi:hypothetical protein
MCLTKGKPRFPLVVKTHHIPLRFGVAVFTAFAKPPLVHIISLMTITAYAGWLVMKCCTLVAGTTGHWPVTATQGKTRTRVIERAFFPSGGRVTVATVYAELSLVHVVLAVARNAGFWCLTILLASPVAGFTFDLGMQPQQYVISQRVIKRRLFECDNVGSSPLVLGVAIIARSFPLEPTVVSTASRHIGGDVLVAIQTQLGLFAFFEGNVTFSAIALNVRMPLDDFSRHQQRFEISRRYRT